MFGIIVFFILVAYLLKDYGKGICYVIILSPFLMPIFLWGKYVPTFLGFIICMLSFFKLKKVRVKEKFPLTAPFIVLAASYFLSNYFAAERHNGFMISAIINNLLLPVIFFYVYQVDKKRMQSVFLKACVVFGFIVGLYSCFETIIGDNPIMRMLMEHGWINMEKLVDGFRYGVKRSQGIFTMHGTNGTVAVLLFTIIAYAMKTRYLKRTKSNYFLLFMLCLTVLFTGTRSVILAFFVCLFAFVDIKKFKIKYWIAILLFTILTYLTFQQYFNDIFMSFSDTEHVEGSNTDMRETQFDLAIMFLLQSPILGHGLSYCANNVMGTYQEMYGAESLWFPVMIDTGMLGVIGHIMFFIGCSVFCMRGKNKKPIFFVLALLLLNTMSSIPGFVITWMFPFLLLLVEMNRNIR